MILATGILGLSFGLTELFLIFSQIGKSDYKTLIESKTSYILIFLLAIFNFFFLIDLATKVSFTLMIGVPITTIYLFLLLKKYGKAEIHTFTNIFFSAMIAIVAYTFLLIFASKFDFEYSLVFPFSLILCYVLRIIFQVTSKKSQSLNKLTLLLACVNLMVLFTGYLFYQRSGELVTLLSINIFTLMMCIELGIIKLVFFVRGFGTQINDKNELFKFWKLTERQKEVVNLILEGKQNSEIAEKLFIAEGTVRSHTTRIYQKAGVDSRVSLVLKINKALNSTSSIE